MADISALKTVTYTSRAHLDVSEEDLRQIHDQARHLNALDGITGLLAFDGARFLQIIEGTEEAIDHLVERLRNDPRHTAFEIRDERMVDARSFPEWSMEMVRVSAGFENARSEIASLLPGTTSAAVRDLALRMSDALSAGP
ncbi:MAG TPA: BLUF domain-containing protein [Allosphingosinicella sp.]|nr:BLUF domain-containing protein [Allosphingosinicella sp.]